MKPIDYNKTKDSSLEREMNYVLNNFKEEDSHYEYNGIPVPRVTHILSDMIHEEYLMNWANYIGRYKRQDHNDVRDRSANIGTITHSAIENYVLYNTLYKFEEIEDIDERIQIKNAFYSFKRWWDILLLRNTTVIFMEKPLICEYFGGTLDMLISVDRLMYLVDFKTSNHYNYKYHLQTAAYRYMLYKEYGIIVDGIIILKLCKHHVLFEEQVIDLRNYDHLQYINQCQNTFFSLVYAYYNRKISESLYDNKYKKS